MGRDGDGTTHDRNSRWVRRFLREAALERDLAPRTRAAYARDLALLLLFARRRRVGVEALATRDLVAFLASRRRAGDGRTTRARRTAAVRGFFAWLAETGRIPRDPALLLPATPPARLLPKALDTARAAALLVAPRGRRGPLGLRDRLALELLYGAGLRASEVAALRLEDADRERGLLRVTGKGRKERRVPLGAPGLEVLERWLGRGRPRLVSPTSGDALLLGRGGRPMTRAGIWRIVKRWAPAAACDARTSPHTLRHTFATHLVQGGADLRAVQEMLGHASIDTTQIYTSLAQEHLQKTHRRYHPRG